MHRLVEYATAASAVDAVQRLDGMELGERRIHVRFDRSHYDTAGGTTVFVGNLPWSTTDGELHELFSAYHPYSCSVMKNMAGRSRGFAIVRFQSEEQAQRAILDMNGYDLSGRVLEVSGFACSLMLWTT
jgi:polyadenylate-binding protein